MKTTLFLIAALFISTITFSQTSRKGYTYYKNTSDLKMNKAELIDAMAKEANNSKKRVARKGRNPQTGATPIAEARHNWIQGRSRANISKPTSEQTTSKTLRKRPGRSKTIGNYATIKPTKK